MMDKKKKEDYEKQMLINELEQMPARVIATAYLHALNYHLYGVDVTEKWKTATQNTANVERAYLKGRRDEAEFWFRAKPDELLLSRRGVLDLHKKYESLVAPDMTKYGYELESLPTVRGPKYTLEGAIEALGRQQAAGSKDLISRSSLLAKYDEQHEGPPGRARKLIEDEPPALGTNLAEDGTDLISRQQAIDGGSGT